MRMMVLTGDIVRTHAPELMDVYARDMCLGDLRVATRALRENDAADLAAALRLGRDFLAQVDPGVTAALPEPDRRRLALFLRGEFEQLSRAVRDEG
jgi:hypothetical protein